MNRYLKTGLNNGGVPITATDIHKSEDEVYKAFIATIVGLTNNRAGVSINLNDATIAAPYSGGYNSEAGQNGVVLSGCYASYSNPTYIDQGNSAGETFSLIEGYVRLGDDICLYSGDDGLGPVATTKHPSLYKDSVVYTARVHYDGSSKNVRETKSAIYGEFTYGAPSSSDHVFLDKDGAYLDGQSQAQVENLSSGLYTSNQNILTNSTNISTVNTLSEQIIGITTPADWTVYGTHYLQLLKMSNGMTYLRGALNHSTSVYSTICNIPSGWRPSDGSSHYYASTYRQQIITNDSDNPNNTGSSYLLIDSSGNVTTDSSGSWSSGFIGWINIWWKSAPISL